MRKALQIAGMSLSALFGNWARSALTTLGIVIGVAAVIMIMSIGAGVQGQVTGQLNDLGPNLITIAPGSGGASEAGAAPDDDGGPGAGAAAVSTLTTKDADAVAALPSVSAASPNVSVTLPIDGAGYSFSGVDPSYQEISSVKLETGRFVEGDNELVLTRRGIC